MLELYLYHCFGWKEEASDVWDGERGFRCLGWRESFRCLGWGEGASGVWDGERWEIVLLLSLFTVGTHIKTKYF